MAKKTKVIPKKKKTLIPEPNWKTLQNAKSEEQKLNAFTKAHDFVHYEIPDREQLHWLKKWLREESNWNVHKESVTLPDVYMLSFAKYGWLAIRLGFMPKSVYDSLHKNLLPLLKRAEEIKNQNTSESIEMPEDKEHFLHPDKVKKWLAIWKDYVKARSKDAESNDRSARLAYQSAETYVYNMQTYLRTGVWNDFWWGENRDKRIMYVVKTPAYDQDGNIKRTKGYYYPDIGQVWTGEFDNET